MTTKDERLSELSRRVASLYAKEGNPLPFHGWPHIQFVRNKSLEFGESIGANLFIVESAALTHDLNYLVERDSTPEIGSQCRLELLRGVGYTELETDEIESIILQTHTQYRATHLQHEISPEGQALSDGDTLFKALPITPILFAHRYLKESNIDILTLAEKITSEQNPLMTKQIYFYTQLAREKYLKWAQTNLVLWNNVLDSLNESSVQTLLRGGVTP